MEIKKGSIKNILLVITFAVFLYWVLQNLYHISDLVNYLSNIFSPIIFGLALAFICNALMVQIETRLFSVLNRKFKKVWPKIRRPISILLTFIVIVSFIALIMLIIVPELIKTIISLTNNIPSSFNAFQNYITNFFGQHPEIKNYINNANLNWSSITQMATQYGKQFANTLIGSTITVTTGIFHAALTLILGIVIAINILLQKEKLQNQIVKIMQAYLPQNVIKKIIKISSLANRTFSNFIIGTCTEACILASLCFIGMQIFRFPYALLISVLVAFMALIPMIGSFLSVSIGAILIFTIDPIQALWFIVFFNVLQQIEGNFIYPRVVGSKVGLPAIWVLIAIIIGGNTFGVFGMIVNIPLFSVMYVLLRENVYKRIHNSTACADTNIKKKNEP